MGLLRYNTRYKKLEERGLWRFLKVTFIALSAVVIISTVSPVLFDDQCGPNGYGAATSSTVHASNMAQKRIAERRAFEEANPIPCSALEKQVLPAVLGTTVLALIFTLIYIVFRRLMAYVILGNSPKKDPYER